MEFLPWDIQDSYPNRHHFMDITPSDAVLNSLIHDMAVESYIIQHTKRSSV